MNNKKVEKLLSMKDSFINNRTFSGSNIKYIKDESLKIKQASYFLAKAQKIVVIVGAGCSTEVGIPCFRDSNGIYSKVPEELFSIKNFESSPTELIKVLLNLFNKKYEIGETHKFLKKLEEDKEVTIISQNIDRLFSKTNPKNIINIHGNIDKAICLKCGNSYEMLWEEKELGLDDFKCNCGEYLKPDIVLYGEDVKDYNKALREVEKADVILILGEEKEPSLFQWGDEFLSFFI